MKNILTILIISFAFVLAAENPVLNPGFEAGIQNWLYAEECGNIAAYEGVDGGNAFLYRRDDPKSYGVLSQNLRLQQGKKYKVGAKLRNTSNAPITVNMTLEYSRGSTYLGGNYFNGQLPQDGDDWQELSCEFTAGGDDLSYRLGIYLEHGNTGSFYVDDVYITEVYPEWCIRQSWPWGYTAQPSDEIIYISNYTAIPCEEQQIRLELFSGSNFIAEMTCIPDNSGVIYVPASGLEAGNYRINATLYDYANNLLGTTEIPLTVVEKRNRTVEIEPNGSLLINGKPFYPVGIFSDSHYTNDHTEKIAAMGFNSQMSYRIGPYGDFEQMLTELDKCYELGIMVTFCLKFNFDISKNPEDFQKQILPWIERVKSHPALLGYYLMDEPAMAMVPLAEECLAWLNKVDPEHPVWAVFANQMSINDFLGGVNIVGTDIYPLHSTDSTVYPIVRGVTDIRQKQLPLWVVVQSYPMSNYMSNSSYYFPTPMEILSQGVAGYIGNAGGLLYYSFMDLRPNNPNADRDILAMSQSINILKSLSVFNSCEHPEQMIVHTEENTAWRLLYDGFEYRLLVLAPNSSGSLTISLPENMEMIHSVTGKTVSENGMLTFCGNKNDCDIISIRTNTAATYNRY